MTYVALVNHSLLRRTPLPDRPIVPLAVRAPGNPAVARTGGAAAAEQTDAVDEVAEGKPPVFAGDGVEADPCFTAEGRSLYFISTRSLDGMKRKDLDIWRARIDAAGRWTIEHLGAAVNTVGDEYEALPAADGSRLIVMADGGLYESRKTPTGWSPRVKLGADVNANGTEIGALFSPSGRSLLFARDTKGPDSGEFFVWYEIGAEAWPPECPASGR